MRWGGAAGGGRGGLPIGSARVLNADIIAGNGVMDIIDTVPFHHGPGPPKEPWLQALKPTQIGEEPSVRNTPRSQKNCLLCEVEAESASE